MHENTEQKIYINATGQYLPNIKVLSSELDLKLGLKPGTCEKTTGIKLRHFAGEESASDMAIKAIESALEKSTITKDEIDCIIAASGTMEQAIPYNGAHIAAKLKSSSNIPAFDINMTCLGSLMAIDVATQLIQQGGYKNIVIVASEIASVGLDYNDIKIAGNFGDGSGAIILSTTKPENKQKILARAFNTYPEGLTHCVIPGGGTKLHPSKTDKPYNELCYFQMNGKKAYQLVRSILPKFIEQLLSSVNLSVSDIDWIIPHQASSAALKLLPKILKIDSNKFIDIIATHGNQISASLLITLDHAITNKLKSGDKIMLLGSGAGLSVGAMIIEY